MKFQEFCKNYFDILMVPIFQFFLPLFPVLPVIFSLILNKSVVELSALKSVIALAAKTSLSLTNFPKIPHVFE